MKHLPKTIFVLLSISLFFAQGVLLHGAIPTSERAALISFYNATGGDSWNSNTNWKGTANEADGFSQSGTEGTWYGVTVSGDHVTQLHFQGSGLAGQLPGDLEDLPFLVHFYLGYTSLGGTIPPEMGNLTNLTLLDIHNSNLTGEIPSQLANLTNLITLYLYDNQLSGSIPSGLGNLVNLEALHLTGNQLTGSIPSDLGNLAKLEGLYLLENQLTGSIPAEIGNMTALTNLFLGENQLSGTIPPKLGSLANLTMLMLKDNQLTGSIPPELGNLPALTWLNMQDNQLSGTIPPELGGLTTLSGLLLADNRLTGSIPPELSGMTSLGSLYLGNNQLSGTIPDFLISMNLGAIDLSDNQFSGTLPTDFPDNPMLSELKLNGNRLSGTIPAVLGNLQNLHTLRLENNQLTGSLPVELGNLPMLRFFRANNNDLTGGIPEEFSNLSDLFTLDLSSNQLSGPIPPGLGDLTDLNTLLLSYNRLSGGIPAELGNIVWLRYLHLAGNQLSGAVPAGLTGIIELYELDISYNALYVEDAAVKDMLDSYVPIWSDTQTIAPTGLSAGASSAGGARLSWTPIRYSGGDGAYEVYVSTQSGGPWTYAGETADKTASYYDVSGLLSGEYYFVVRTRTDAHIFNQGDLTSAYGTEVSATALPPSIGFNRQTLSFGYVSGKNAPASQPLGIIAGKPQVTWSLTHDASWLGLSQVSGSGSYTLGVSITPTGLSAGTYTGTISMSAVGGTVAAGTVSVTLTVYDPHNGSEPFGDFSTPTENSIARGGIPVTGWALDDVEVKKVTIYRMENNSKMYVGDAVFVEGARPDVEAAYPGYPLNYRAGWGYLLLTNFLPDNGNGTVTLAAVAEDAEGNRVTLGTRTINCDNANAVKPFGAIDTPAQGGTASGSAFENWGWALTPAPNIIPTDGSTIDVWIDGVNVGNPTYDLYREDIAALFPGYGNSNGAIGYLALDCGEYADGVHTISWTATDDAGNADGIGSRYFTISNAGSRTEGIQSRQGIGPVFFSGSHADVPVSPVPPMVTVGFSRDAAPIIPRTVDGTGSVTIKEGGRIAIHIRKPYSPTDKHQMLKETDPVSSFEGTMVYKGKLYPLPIGSQLDGNAGQFYWLPGPGFIGPYRFEFIETTPNGEKIRHILEVIIEPALQ